MSLLRLASDSVKRIPLGAEDDNDYIEVVEDISKRDFNRIAVSMPVVEGETITVPQALDFQRLLFDTLVKGWSLKVPPTLDNYELLDRKAADAIDTAVAKHFESLTPSPQEADKSDQSGKTGRAGARQS